MTLHVTSFYRAFNLEAIKFIEFYMPRLRIEVKEHLDEETTWYEWQVEFGKLPLGRFHNMIILEILQRH